MSHKKIIISIIVTLLSGAVVSAALQAYKIKIEKEMEAREAITDNPFYEEFRSAGARYGLNMDFTRRAVCVKGTQLELEKIPLLGYGRQSCDILIVGDSSMAWGMIPEVVEQMTGLKVGVFGSEALVLNATIAKLIDNLASYYLKDDGLLIISFGGWTQEQNANSMVLVYIDWIYTIASMSNAEFAAYMEKWKKDQAGGAADGLLDRLAFSAHRNSIRALKDTLAEQYCFSLFQLPLYNDYIEPFINPKWHKQKMEMKSKIKCYLRWNNKSIVMYSSYQGKRSIHSGARPDPGYTNKDIAIVSALLKKIPRRKAYQIHVNFDHSKYARLRSIYASYYRDSFGLIDLGADHPADASYEMDESGHTINTGGFYQSVLIGNNLKRHFSTLGKLQPAGPAIK